MRARAAWVCVAIVAASCGQKSTEQAAPAAAIDAQAPPPVDAAAAEQVSNVDPARLQALIDAARAADGASAAGIDAGIEAIDALAATKHTRAVMPLAEIARRELAPADAGQRLVIAALRGLGGFPGDSVALETLVWVIEGWKDRRPEVIAVAALALAEHRAETAIVPLLRVLVATPTAYQQIRRALVAIGLPVVDHLRRAVRGEHPELEALAVALELNVDCDEAMGEGTRCQGPGSVAFKALAILGDLRSRDAVPDILAVLAAKPMPAFFTGGQPGPTTHDAAMLALQRIGDPRAAGPLLAYAADTTKDLMARAAAASAYGAVDPDTPDLAALAALFAEDYSLGMGAGSSYMQFASTAEHVATMRAASQQLPAELRASADAMVAAADKAIACKGELGCLLDLFESADPDSEAGMFVVVRSLSEVARMDDAASIATDRLLASAGSDNRVVRMWVLETLAATATLPCNRCVTRLDEVIAADAGKTALAALTVDTEVVRNYFRWATAR